MISFKVLSKIVFTVALMALGNSLIVQPALEFHHHHPIVSHEQEHSGDESDCCFICHPAHFQWMANASSPSLKRTLSTSFISRRTLSVIPDPHIGSIFRPPVSFS